MNTNPLPLGVMPRKRLYFFSPRDMRKNRADCVHIMKTCQQFAEQGYEVILVTPRVRRSEYKTARRDIFKLYGMAESFQIVELPTFLFDNSKALWTKIQKILFFSFYGLTEILRGRMTSDSIIYGKCYAATTAVIGLRRIRLCRSCLLFEKAVFIPSNHWHGIVVRNVDGLICGRSIYDRVLVHYGLSHKDVHRAGFPSQFPEISSYLESEVSRDRIELGLPVDKRLVVYAGKIDNEMPEIRYILEAARLVPDAQFVLVGMKTAFRSWFNEYLQERNIENVTLIGFQPLQHLYDYVNAADILISYYDSMDPLSSTQRGPTKSTVYMCMAKPVIMADMPSMRDWWSDDEIFFVPPDQPALLAEKIRYVCDHPIEANRKATACLEFAKANTYQSRCSDIAKFINSLRRDLESSPYSEC